MDLANLTLLILLIATTGYTVLPVGLLLRAGQRERQLRLFLGFLAVSALWELALFLNQADGVLPNGYLVLLLGGTLLLGMTTSFYVDWPHHRRWILAGGMAMLGALLLDLFVPLRVLGLETVFRPEPTLGGLAAMLFWLLLSLSLLVRTWRTYRITRLPWHANRLLHWFIFLLLTFTGEGLTFLENPLLFLTGQAIRFAGVLGLARAVSSHRLFDVQTRLRHLLAFVLVGLASVIPAAIVLTVFYQLTILAGLNLISSYVIFLLIFAVSFLLYQPYRRLVDRLADRLLLGKRIHAGQVVRSYSQAISRTLDVEQLSLVIIGIISEILETKRGALMLVSKSNSEYEVEPVPAMGQISRQTRFFPEESTFIRALTDQRQPLLQYDIDFNPELTGLGETEREWLAGLAMDVFVPVQTDNQLIGLIALGPKHSGRAYRPDELELVQVMADQTVIALQNARLYSELNQQNDRIRMLNQDLRQQNERLEILDKVKSDFITIASHELRTPLTQVKGYADILQAMNEEQSLTREQIREIMNHINRASARLEKLITAMLDASQLEVSGMELSYIRTKLETVVQLAVDPIAFAIQERQLKLNIHGLQDVPPLQADFKRLVQAFHNLIGNAVKYTPDYGTITVSAELVPGRDQEIDFVEVIVEDSGIGIDARYHDLIFEKFFRIGDPELHSTGSTKFKGAGPGLGLHIVKGVIEAHGGRIWVESFGEDESLLPGSRFHVILPVEPPALREKLLPLDAAAAETVVERIPEWQLT